MSRKGSKERWKINNECRKEGGKLGVREEKQEEKTRRKGAREGGRGLMPAEGKETGAEDNL